MEDGYKSDLGLDSAQNAYVLVRITCGHHCGYAVGTVGRVNPGLLETCAF